MASKGNDISSKWREIQGTNDWKDLLSTSSIDKKLRREIIKYGEFAQACYDGFEYDEDSPQSGNSKFTEDEFLESVCLPNTGYQITKYIYATSELGLPGFFKHTSDSHDGETWSRDSNWMGFVAVATSESEIRRLGRRDIVIAWRGTVTKLEWIENIKDLQQPSGLDPADTLTRGVKVEAGFLNIYTSKISGSRFNKQSAREQVLTEVNRLVKLFQEDQLSITVTGHSLGGALALLNAYDIAELEVNGNGQGMMSLGTNSAAAPHRLKSLTRNSIPVTVFSFCAPRVGNRAFRERCAAVGVKALRVFNKRDIVPKVPGFLINEDNSFINWLDLFPWAYTHVGRELELDSHSSPDLRRDAGIVEQHNLEALLHLVDGYQGAHTAFRSSGNRNVALINKGSDFLRPEFGIQPNWDAIQ